MRLPSRWLRRFISSTRRDSQTKPNRLRSARMNLMSLEERAVPATYMVSLLGDAGMMDGSDTTGLSGDIRYCIDQANLNPGADTIVFSPTTFSSPSTITLSGPLAMTDSTTIDGASVGGKNNIAISGGGTVRVFSLAGANLAEFKNISIIDGNSTIGASGGGGGAIHLLATASSVTFDNCLVANHKNTSTGGAISLLSGYTGLVTINNSTFSGNTGTRGGAIYFWTSGALSVSGSTFSGNKATGTGGGAVTVWSGSATITNTKFLNNEATAGQGGGLEIASSAPLTLTGSVFSGNKAATTGGGLHQASSGNSTITATTFDGNTATTSGGGMSIASTRVVVVDASTFSNNTSALGGGINQSSGTITFTNSTISGNKATGTTGGGGFNITGGTQNIRNSTVAFNSATGAGASGGGLRRSAGTLTLSSTIISTNTSSTGGRDAHSTAAVNVAGDDNLIGDPTGGNITYTGVFYTGDAKLASLTTALGGTTAYHPLLIGSPAINKGNDIFGLVFDQRGLGYPRVDGIAADIGSFEGFLSNPSASATLPNVPPVNPTYVALVTYSDDVGINTTKIDTNDVRLTGPGYGSPAVPTSAVIKSGMMGDKTVTVEYTFTPPGGTWDFTDNGTYTLVMQANEVFDTEAVPLPVLPGPIGSFNANIGLPVLVVDNAGDLDDGNYTPGNLTLREAIKLANNAVGTEDTITFAAALSGSTITFGTPINITDPVIINGIGAANIALSGGMTSRVFEVTGNILATFNDMSIIDGKSTVGGSAGGGGAIFAKSIGTSITINNSIVSGHANSSTGGAMSLLSGFTGLVTINNSTFSGNSSTRGGAIYFWTTGNLTISNSKFLNNTSSGGGGAINPWSVLTTITDSTFANNTAVGNGGALEMSGAATVSISGSTFSGNTAALGGAIYQASTSLTVTNSTVSGNSASGAGGGGGIAVGSATTTIRNSTIANNNALAGNGGGIRKSSATGTLTLGSTIVATNTAATGGPDIHGTVAIAIAGGDNLVGVGDAGNFTLAGTNYTGTSGSPLDPLLGALKNNGGPTETQEILPGSPAAFKGNNDLVLTWDQRGPGFPRSSGGKTDIGAVQGDPTIPGGSATGPTIKSVSMSDQTITVTYTVGVGSIDAGTLDNNDIIVTGPFGYSKAGKLIGGPYLSAPTVVVQYTVPPNDNGTVGAWDGADAGLYTVNLQPNQVKTLAMVAAPAGPIGSFRVAIGNVYLVDALGDDDDGIYTPGNQTFREALNRANANAFATDTITFSAGVFTPGTQIILNSGYTVTDSVVINGPGLNNLEFNGGGAYRIFEISDGSSTVIDVSMSNLKVSGGAVTSANGAGFLVTGEKLSLTNVEITSNNVNTAGNGGGISLTGTATLNLEGVRIIANSAAGNGGGIDGGPGGSTITINNSTIANNTNGGNGPGISNGDVVMTITNSTISGNTSSSPTSVGGGIGHFAGKITIENSTISNNQAGQGGGIGLQSWGDNLSVRHSTITGNFAFGAAGNGGGIARVSGSGAITIYSSAVTGNVGVAGPDVFSSGTVNVNYSAIFSNLGFTLSGSSGNNLGFGVDAKLGLLANNGGPTETHLPAQGSPLYNAGPAMTPLLFDQRGQPRLQQTRVDIGSVESLNLLPTAVMKSLGPITVSAATPDVVTIVYTDNGTITASSIKTSNVEIIDPNTFLPLTILSATPTPNTNAPSISVDYKFAVPGGKWDTAYNGTYVVRLLAANSVVDNDLNPVVTVDTDIGSFVVSVPATYVVNVIGDVDDFDPTNKMTTLREAIREANNDGVDSKITFDPVVFAGATTIAMTSGVEFEITEAVTITGPGSSKLTLDAGGVSRVMKINTPGSFAVVNISGMRMTGGSATTDGGGITMNAADVTLTDVVVTGNTTTLEGGGINVSTASGKLTLIDSVVSNNSTGPGAQDGGGINFDVTASSASDQVLTVIRSTISGNTASDDGGGIYFFSGGTLVMTDSTLSGNVSTDDGGGVYLWGNNATIINSTISNNTAADGGGLNLRTTTSTLTLRNSTVAFNTGSATGGNIVIAPGWTVNIESSIISNGTSPAGPDINGIVTAATFTLVGNNAAATIPADPTNLINVDPLLGTLSNNGGPTQTHAITAGSPAFNKGNNSIGLLYDQRGVGFNRKVGAAVDIGAFEVQTAAAPPTVTAVLTNGAAMGQHSRVTSIVVNFSETVTIANPSAAFQINRYAGATGGDAPATGKVGYTVTGLDAMNKGSSVTITFNGTGAVGVDPGNSLRDGKYEVIVVASEVVGAGGNLDGNGNGKYDPMDPLMDNNRTTTWRLFGDNNGDGGVTAIDFQQFFLAYGQPAMGSPATFDFNNDGLISAADFSQFFLRYGLVGYQIP
jgi:hypothetical protein